MTAHLTICKASSLPSFSTSKGKSIVPGGALLNAASVGANTVTGPFSFRVDALPVKFIARTNMLRPVLFAATIISAFVSGCVDAAGNFKEAASVCEEGVGEGRTRG